MSISATEGLSGGVFSTGLTSSATESAALADKDVFMQLMVAQLRYQDPLNPTDSGEFLAQTAQFTALEKMQAVAESTGALLGISMAFGSSALVGKQVTWNAEDGTTMTGTVSGVTFGAQGPVFDVDGTEVPLTSVSSVVSGTSASTTSPTTTSPTTTSPATA